MAKDIKKSNLTFFQNAKSIIGKPFLAGIFITFFVFLIYGNTLNNGYTLDDHTVISANRLTIKGVEAIPTMFTHAYWYGYDGSNSSVYRPLSLIVFAIEYEFFGQNARASHLINLLLYSFLCIVILRVLTDIFKSIKKETDNEWMGLIATLIFLFHPIHTEVVANIKSRDEILCLLGIFLSVYFMMKKVNAESIMKTIANQFLSCLFFFLALLSKENAFSFIAIFPLILYFFKNRDLKSSLYKASWHICTSIIYLALRISFLDKSFSGDYSADVMTNSLLAANNYGERIATCFYILMKYILLLIYPQHLCYDYSFNQIPNLGVFDIKVILSAFVIFFLLYVAFKQFRNRTILSFSILYFFISIAIVSNIFIITGASMAERFVFIPSLGYCMVLAYFIFYTAEKFKFINKNLFILLLTGLIITAYGFKTYSRNKSWANNLTLFSYDIVNAPNSARAHLFLGIELLKRTDRIKEAASEMQKAIDINPKYRDAFYNLAIAMEKLENFDSAKNCYLSTIALDSMHIRSYNNLGMVYGKMGNMDKAVQNLQKAIKKLPKYADAYTNLGGIYGRIGIYDLAVKSLHTSVKLNPSNFQAYDNLGIVHAQLGQFDEAIINFKKALQLNPEFANAHFNLAITYQRLGKTMDAEKHYSKAYQLNPALKKQ